MDTKQIAEQAHRASQVLQHASTARKNEALLKLAELLDERRKDVMEANQADMDRARVTGLEEWIIKRLRFDEKKLDGRICSLGKIAALPDPVGQTIKAWKCENGLDAARVRVPLGVILMVYEARPHVTVNAGSFCLKAGNAAILRGGSEAKQCNQVMGEIWKEALTDAGLPEQAVQVVSGSHDDVDALLQEAEFINLVIPRGGKGLIKAVSERSKIPVLKHFEGICHVYADEKADLDKAVRITVDGKCLMPEVCNATETLLVHQGLLGSMPDLVAALRDYGVKIKGCEQTRRAVPDVEPASEEDWGTEYLDLTLSVRVVDGAGQAIGHINGYGSHHTDVIVTEDQRAAARFLAEVDSSVVLHNASTMFCDGETLGMGAEIGISTEKLHARGPMGLEELTSYKFVLRGDGHIMGDYAEAALNRTGAR